MTDSSGFPGVAGKGVSVALGVRMSLAIIAGAVPILPLLWFFRMR